MQARAADAFVHIFGAVITSPASSTSAAVYTTEVARTPKTHFTGHTLATMVTGGTQTDVNLFGTIFTLKTIETVASIEVEVVDARTMLTRNARTVRNLLGAIIAEVVGVTVARVCVWHSRCLHAGWSR
jgi:hypothetical protein